MIVEPAALFAVSVHRCSSRLAHIYVRAWALVLAALIAGSQTLYACPFCTALGPTLGTQCDNADAALLAELVSSDDAALEIRVHHLLKAPDGLRKKRLLKITPAADERQAHQAGALLLALGKEQSSSQSAGLRWSCVWLNEATFAYVARLPSRRSPTVERLPYFARYFEHADPVIAQDAYLEFGHAPLDEIAKLADRLPVDRLRADLLDDSVPPERKGLYGLLLGLAAAAQGHNEVSADFLRLIAAPAGDFRAGFDGVLAGYLWLKKDAALRRLERRYLDNRQVATGDVRHFAAALRVFHDYGHGIERDELLRVYRRLLERPDVAAAAVNDLRRWHDWQALDRVASLFGRPEYDDPAIERSVIAYLLACPLPAAERQVDRLRKLVPGRVTEAERQVGENAGR